MPMNCSARVLDAWARSLIGRVEVLEAKDAILWDHGFDLFGHLGLDGWVFKDRFDDQVTAL